MSTTDIERRLQALEDVEAIKNSRFAIATVLMRKTIPASPAFSLKTLSGREELLVTPKVGKNRRISSWSSGTISSICTPLRHECDG